MSATPALPMGATNPPLCVADFEAAHGFEPDMDPAEVTWRSGACAECGTEGVVFRINPDLTREAPAEADHCGHDSCHQRRTCLYT